MTRTPYITRFDSPDRWAICWHPSSIDTAWFTGQAMTSAALRPRIKYFRSREAAEKAMPKARALVDLATY